jgi:hypothetical protein
MIDDIWWMMDGDGKEMGGGGRKNAFLTKQNS